MGCAGRERPAVSLLSTVVAWASVTGRLSGMGLCRGGACSHTSAGHNNATSCARTHAAISLDEYMYYCFLADQKARDRVVVYHHHERWAIDRDRNA